MKPVAVVAVGAESALGVGNAAYSVGARGEAPTTRIVADAALEKAGLRKPFVARVARQPSRPTGAHPDPARELIEGAARGLSVALDTRYPAWRAGRVALVVGTSSGGMVALTDALSRRARGESIPRDLARAATYFGPLLGIDAALGITPCDRFQVLAACASSAIAIGFGCRLLELGHADLVIAGGYDAVSVFVAAGFECLGATSGTRPAPFRLGRDGMALGEAAALLALVPADGVTSGSVLGYLRGFAASCDAVHITAPDRAGAGLARAALAALEDAGTEPRAVDLVSAHGTATPFNDAAETRALSVVLGSRALDVPVHPFKAVVGHTLGASGALELLASMDAMQHHVLPGAVGEGAVDPDAAVRLLDRNEAGDPSVCLKLSAAFGGANAAMVASRELGGGARALERAAVGIVAVGQARTATDVQALADTTHLLPLQLSRLDALSASAVAAVASVLERAGSDLPRDRTGIVVGTAAATLESNETFDARVRDRGARFAEPKKFLPTTPNLAPGQCAIAFGLLGPSLAVGGGPEAALEALLVAHDFLVAGDAEAVVVVAAEHVGSVVREIWLATGWPLPADGAIAAVLRRSCGTAIDRASLRALLQEARTGQGRLGPADPGWPALARALSELSVG